MNTSQLDFIFNKYGGREKFLKEKVFELFLDNETIVFHQPSKDESEDPILEFDDGNQMLIITEKNKIWAEINDYRPTESKIYVPYEFIQRITVMESVN